jgi:hypothetical protein
MEGPSDGFELKLIMSGGGSVLVDDLAHEMFRYVFGYCMEIPGNRIDAEVRKWDYDRIPGFLINVDIRKGAIPPEIREDLHGIWNGKMKEIEGKYSGLILAGNIASRYNGRIWIEDLEGVGGVKGTRITIFLPAA